MSRNVSAATNTPPKKKAVIKNVTSVNMLESPCEVVKKDVGQTTYRCLRIRKIPVFAGEFMFSDERAT